MAMEIQNIPFSPELVDLTPESRDFRCCSGFIWP
ncbi:hypothetical protein AB7M56_007768 [Bradyrhizobium elkanii]|jgi:hypothetical protein|nr:hypothetical protein [Bradyrhizobium elkanii]MCS3520945.1 hypothetical protein [Bradyrhizobium elkanii]MCS4068602.1 hypothetical protein [Bradyrhizobium elkanii]MCS4084136.1 hypothetical protein [Bradyrhizobium elkanii]MCS4104613.1 hypothetical protein [Bradyrhizobium elkanii]